MDPKELFKEAQILFMQEKHAECIDAFTKALEAGAEPFMTYLSRGAAYLKMKDHDKAVSDFTKATEADGQSARAARAYYYRGSAYMIKEDYEKAILDFTKAIELKPDHGAAFFVRGTCYAQIGKDEESTRDLKTAITYSEAAAQGFVDTFGILRTQFDGVMALISGERKHPSVELTEDETAKIKKWLDEGTEE